MKNILVVLIIAIVCYVGFKKTTKPSEAVLTYQKFTRKLFHGKWNEVRTMIDGDDANPEIRKRQRDQDYGERTGNLGVLNKMTFDVKSETYTNNDSVAKLNIFHVVRCGPKQVMTSRTTDIIKFNHEATLVKIGDAWKVKIFTFALAEPLPKGGVNYTAMN